MPDTACRTDDRLNLVDIRDGSAEIGYRIAEGANGRGYAGEAVRLALAAAAARGVRRVTAMVTVSNLASRRVLERNDFQLSARDEPAWVDVNDSREPVVHFRGGTGIRAGHTIRWLSAAGRCAAHAIACSPPPDPAQRRPAPLA